jgi:hypothetical protein
MFGDLGEYWHYYSASLCVINCVHVNIFNKDGIFAINTLIFKNL